MPLEKLVFDSADMKARRNGGPREYSWLACRNWMEPGNVAVTNFLFSVPERITFFYLFPVIVLCEPV